MSRKNEINFDGEDPISLSGTLDALPDGLELTTGGFAALVGTSANTISDRARTGVLRPSGRNRLPVVSNVRLYCDELRAAAGRHGAGRKSPERERLLAAQAGAAELKLSKLRGELLDAHAVEAEWSDVIRTMRAGMLSLSSRLGARLPNLTRAEIEVVDDEIRQLLTLMGTESHHSTQPYSEVEELC